MNKTVSLREPEKLSLSRYLDFEINARKRPSSIESYISSISTIYAPFNLSRLKQRLEHRIRNLGQSRGDNLWSVLRNLEGRRQLDDRYATIMEYMAEAFPTFDGLVIDLGTKTLYASFLEKGRLKRFWLRESPTAISSYSSC